jgi:hypothetical protein
VLSLYIDSNSLKSDWEVELSLLLLLPRTLLYLPKRLVLFKHSYCNHIQ